MAYKAVRVRFDALPPFSPVVARLLQLIRGDNLNMRQAAELVNSDPSLAAQVLRMANSALFGLSREVTSLLVALNLLGLDRIYSLTITASLKRLAGKVSHLPLARRLWRHSLATAFLAADLSSDEFRDISEDYTAGLLHDLGRLVLLASAPAEYSALTERACKESLDSCELEHEMFGLTHQEAGGRAMEMFGLPKVLVMVASHHHFPANAPLYRPSVELIQSCCQTAIQCGFPELLEAPPDLPEDDLCLYVRERMLDTERGLAA